MMDKKQLFSSSDGSSNRNPRQGRSTSLYSQDSTLEDQKVSHFYQEEDEAFERGNGQLKEGENPPEISTDGSSNRNTPEICPSPLYFRDSAQEHHRLSKDIQGKTPVQIEIKIEEEEEEPYVREREQRKDGRYTRNSTERCSNISQAGEIEDDDITSDSFEEIGINSNLHSARHSGDPSSDPSTHGSFSGTPQPVTRYSTRRGSSAKRSAQAGRSRASVRSSGRKRTAAYAAYSSEEDDDDGAGAPRKLGGGMRNIRFSYEENCVLVHKVIENWSALFGAQSQKISAAQKKYLWEIVVSAVNGVSQYRRTRQHCRKRLSDIKRYLRTKLSSHKKYTDGRLPGDLKLTDFEEELLQVIGEEVTTRLDGPYIDTDRLEGPDEGFNINEQFSAEEEDSRLEDMSEAPVIFSDDEDMEEVDRKPAVLQPDASSDRITTERTTSPLNTRNSTQEDHISLDDQDRNLVAIKVEVKEEEEETYVGNVQECKQEETPPEISTDGRYIRNNAEKASVISPDGETEDGDITPDYPGENLITSNLLPSRYSADLSSDLSSFGGSFHDLSPSIAHQTSQRGQFIKRLPQAGRGAAQMANRKRSFLYTTLSSEEEEEDEAGPPKKLGGGLRNIRFSHEENCVLVRKVIENWTNLYGSQCQKISAVHKKYLWESVVSAVNAVSQFRRTRQHCRKRLSDIKRYLRTKLGGHKKYARGSGAGLPLDLRLTEYEEELLQVVGEEVINSLESSYTERQEDPEDLATPEQLSPAPSAPEEEDSRQESLPEISAGILEIKDEKMKEAYQLQGNPVPTAQSHTGGFGEDTSTVSLLPADNVTKSGNKETATQESAMPTALPQHPIINQVPYNTAFEESFFSTLSTLVSKVERLNAQSKKEQNRSHRLLNTIHTDLLLLTEEFKMHREQQSAQTDKIIQLLEESNALKKSKLQLMQERGDLVRGQVPATSAATLETPAPSPVDEAVPASLPKHLPESHPEEPLNTPASLVKNSKNLTVPHQGESNSLESHPKACRTFPESHPSSKRPLQQCEPQKRGRRT
ncbi:uncharacterized protein [Hyperolius riggenbachi]|uniref:uncharacterized protein isoform X2 n=1 Tax=Hyperolius riggenbachi TaxID=752182 RepID=UPI0035A3B976